MFKMFKLKNMFKIYEYKNYNIVILKLYNSEQFQV